MTTSTFGTSSSLRPLDECLACASALRPAVTTITDVGHGGFASRNGLGGLLGGSFSVGGFQVDTMSLMSDPIATLAGSCANFLMDYLPPLPQMLKAVGGDPRSVQARATAWTSTSQKVETTAKDYLARVNTTLRGWTGPAADSYRKFASTLSESIDSLSRISAGIGKALSAVSGIVERIRAIIRNVIAELVGKLISWVAQALGTWGIGLSWVIPRAVTAIAQRVKKVKEWVTKLVTSVRDALQSIRTVTSALKTAGPALTRISEALGAGSSPRVAMAGGGSIPSWSAPRPAPVAAAPRTAAGSFESSITSIVEGLHRLEESVSSLTGDSRD